MDWFLRERGAADRRRLPGRCPIVNDLGSPGAAKRSGDVNSPYSRNTDRRARFYRITAGFAHAALLSIHLITG